MKKNDKTTIIALGLIFLEVFFFFQLFSLMPSGVMADLINQSNVTVPTYLDVGNVYPEVLNVSIEDDAASFSLTANSTTTLLCQGLIRDWNGEDDISNVWAEFFDASSSFNGTSNETDDNNNHYTNISCNLTKSFGTWNGVADSTYLALTNCTFEIEYYANATNWNCTIKVNDSVNWVDYGSDNITISELLALGLPDSINYGTVNATEVSAENITNVTNFGNVGINLSLSGYGISEGDGLAMNCTLGNIGNITIEHEKYNLSASNNSVLTLAQTSAIYTNLSSSATVKQFDLNYRHNDTVNEATKESYWRIYVPIGVAGTCNGSIIFGAVSAPAA